MDRPVAVIGGGMVGTAIAYELVRAGATTVLVERDIEPQGASAFSFASITSFDEPQRDVYLLKNHGIIGWRKWAKTFGDQLGVRFPGEIRWAETKESGHWLISMIERASGRGYPVRSLMRDEIVAREPAARPGEVVAASVAPDDGQVDPVQAIDVLRGAFVDAGGTIMVGRASLMIEDPSIVVRVGDERFEASNVVIAAGAETAALLERLGWDVPMDPSPGLLTVTDPIEPFLNGTVYVYPKAGAPIHIKQMADGRVLIGERAQDQVARTPTIEHARALLGQARRSFPALEAATVDHFTVEWRPMPRDRMPIIGPMPGFPSLYVATGHSGIMTAPAVAAFVSQELVQGTEVDRLRPFRPGRFSAHGADVYRSIEEAFGGSSDIYIG